MVDYVLPDSYTTLKHFGYLTSGGSLLPPHLGYNLLHLRWERDTETILLQRLAALELRLRLLDTENLLAALVTITYSMPVFHKGL